MKRIESAVLLLVVAGISFSFYFLSATRSSSMSEVEGSRSDHIRSRFVRYCRVRVRSSARSWEKRNYLCYSHTSSPHLFHQQLASSNKDNMASAGTSRQKHRLQQQNGEWLFQYFLAFPSPACYSNSWLHKPIVHWRRLASGASNWKANKCKKHERKLFPCRAEPSQAKVPPFPISIFFSTPKSQLKITRRDGQKG